MVGKKGLSEVLGLNINGDLPDCKIADIALKADRAKVTIWIGENELFKDPFYVADLIADFVSVPIGFGIVSPLRRSCSEIIEKIRDLIKNHPNDFLLGIAPGNFEDPKVALKITLRCLRKLKDNLNIPIFCGCSSPKITKESSKIADGILFNYGYPDFLKWITKFVERDIVRVAFAPALILPSKFEQDLLLACAIVSCSSRRFVDYFGFDKMCEDLARLNFKKLISIRQNGGNLFKIDEFGKILKYRDVLLKKFSISGNFEDLKNKIRELLNVCDHVVLGDPFFRDDRSVELLKGLL